jgi:glycosyltransferase involved in cell wall biosynthesis
MQNHTGQLTRALDSLGVRQTVVTTRPPGAAPRRRMGDAQVLRVGMPVSVFRQGWAVPAARLARRHARAADVVHAHLGEDLAVLPIALQAARAADVPLVVTVHTSLRHTFSPASLKDRALKAVGGRIEQRICALADRVVVLTPRLAGVIACNPERVHVIPSGVTPAAFVDGGPDPFGETPHPRVLFVGRLARQKDPLTLVEAAARLRTPGAQVVLVGDGPLRGADEARIGRLGVGDRVHVAGFQAHKDVPAWLAHADVFAMPSAYEELGSALLEAMQAGLPIVASDTGGIPDAVGDAARLVPPGDPAALAEAIDALLADPQARSRLSARATERAERYDWASLAEAVLDVYAGAREALEPVTVPPTAEEEDLIA